MRRFRSRGSRPRQVIQSFKKVLDFAPTSLIAGKVDRSMTLGTDSVAAGQTGVTDNAVPTGAVVTKIAIHGAVSNLIVANVFIWLSIQRVHSGQSTISPRVVGGNPQRNQVHYQTLRMVGPTQTTNFAFTFKVPKKFQRVREGDEWQLVMESDATTVQAFQIIYTFYR